VANRIRKQWEQLGASDPYWAVLTHPGKKGRRWDKAEFFQTGVDEIAGVMAALDRLGLVLARRTALDYGCGVGRLSRALAPHFERVIAVDISQAMVDEARANTREVGNVDVIRGSGRDLREVPDATVDLIYSNIALQHSPADMQRSVIREMGRVIAPGGVVVFQTPSHPNLRNWHGVLHKAVGTRGLAFARRILLREETPMELHAVPKADVLALLARGGLVVRAVEPDHSAGAGLVGYRYIARKP
jgi:SAM-dependent methyltransferase